MSPELLTVIVASVSCVAFSLMILMMVVVLYRKNPLCCRFTPPRTDELPHYHSRHSLIGIAHNEHRAAMNQGAFGQQLPVGLFIVGKPTDYHLNGALPRLPSYESVRKKDRQRQIHSMISRRFGLSGCHDEPPPTYEETLGQSVDVPPANLCFPYVHPSVPPRVTAQTSMKTRKSPVEHPRRSRGRLPPTARLQSSRAPGCFCLSDVSFDKSQNDEEGLQLYKPRE